MQQSQWIILSGSSCGSGCYCMAEGSNAEHTCPATCLHHRARAGRDSVCQCLQWGDYVPVLRHLQCSSGCSAATANICQAGGGCGGGKPHPPAEKCRELKCRREHVSMCCCCKKSNSARMEEKGDGEKEHSVARSLFLKQKTPVTTEGEKTHSPTICGKRIT